MYRGGNYSDELLERLTTTGTFSEKAFFSTTLDHRVAFKGDTLFVINSRGGARKVDDISGAMGEKEATFAPGARFKVLKIEDYGKKVETGFGSGEKMRQRIVYLDEIVDVKQSRFWNFG